MAIPTIASDISRIAEGGRWRGPELPGKFGGIVGDQVIWHLEDALRTAIGDRLVEKPELILFPGEPTRREIAAFSVIIAR